MCVDIVWEWKMIAVIMVIILAVKGSLEYCVFALLPAWDLVFITLIHHTAWGQRYPFWTGM